MMQKQITKSNNAPLRTSNFCLRIDASIDASLASSAFNFSRSPAADSIFCAPSDVAMWRHLLFTEETAKPTQHCKLRWHMINRMARRKRIGLRRGVGAHAQFLVM